MKLSLYPANTPNILFKKLGFKYYTLWIKFNHYFFKLLPFKKEFFYGEKCNNLESNGCIEVNQLENSTCKKLIEYIEDIVDKDNLEKCYISKGVYRQTFNFNLKDEKLRSYFSENEYENLRKTFFEIKNTIESLGPFRLKPTLIAQKLYAFDSDEGDTNTIMHIDRYVPAVKAFVFLTNTEVNGSSFEFVPNSHLINQEYIYRVLEKSKEHIDSKKLIHPFSPEMPINKFKKYGFEGQAIVTATNGLHRREPFQKSGQFRYTIRFVLYNSISLKMIIKKILKKIFI